MRPLPLLLLAACHPWDLPGDGSVTLTEPTWDANVVAAEDGVYVSLPAADALARVRSDGSWSLVDTTGAGVDRMVLAPDGQTVLTWLSWPICEDDDPKIDLLSECDPDDLLTGHEFALVKDGEVLATHPDEVVPHQYNALAFDADASLAAAWIDFDAVGDIEIDGVLDPSAVVFVPLDGGEPVTVPVGFAPDDVLFTAGAEPRAVVLSRSQVAVVDLASSAITVTYPLTLDPDAAVQPTDVVLTPDGRYALVSVQGSADLYVLDLEQESIDLVELDGVPSDLWVDPVNDRTVIVYPGVREVDLLEHAYFEVESFELDEPVTHILDAGGRAVLYNGVTGYHDVYLFDVASGQLTEYRAENPVMDMTVTADQRLAVATLDRENGGGGGASAWYDQHYGVGIFDLSDDKTPISLLLEGRPLGFALVQEGSHNYALVLAEGVDELLQIDLDAGGDSGIELSLPPLGIAAQPGGDFVIAEDSPVGALAFLTPGGDEVTEVAGFALQNLLREYTLPRRGEESE